MLKIKLRDVRAVMMAVNFIAVLFVSVFIAVTTEWICSRYEARDFLDTLHAIPVQPRMNVIVVAVLYLLLVVVFTAQEKVYKNRPGRIYLCLVLEFVISAVIVVVMNFNYNGIFFLVFTGVIYYTKGERGKYLVICLALISFLLTDAELLSINYDLYSINDYFNYYDASVQQYLVGGYHLLISLNIILFNDTTAAWYD